MNDIQLGTKGFSTNKRPTSAAERHPEDTVIDVASGPIRALTKGTSYRRARTAIILALWALQYWATSILVIAEGRYSTSELYVPRLLVTLGNIIISFGMVAVQDRLREYSLALRGAVAVILGVTAPAISVLINNFVFYRLYDFSSTGLPTIIDFAQDYLMRFWIFGVLSLLILALSYASDVREREQRILALRALAHSAQLRALRNQLNPHFLFNALNSIAGLMRTRRPADAETMVENLGDFLRTTLSLDPQSMIPLAEELRLQDLYLSIEKVRFPDRLRIEASIPPELEQALVPSLLTQPLIENSIKYAVARSTETVTLTVAAERSGNSLVLTVADDGGNADPVKAPSSHLGLRNIAERLAVHFGDEAAIESHPLPERGYINRLTLPLSLAQ